MGERGRPILYVTLPSRMTGERSGRIGGRYGRRGRQLGREGEQSVRERDPFYMCLEAWEREQSRKE